MGTGDVGISREIGFVVDTDSPAFRRDRMRSAMLPPPVLTIALSASSSALGDLRPRLSRRTSQVRVRRTEQSTFPSLRASPPLPWFSRSSPYHPSTEEYKYQQEY